MNKCMLKTKIGAEFQILISANFDPLCTIPTYFACSQGILSSLILTKRVKWFEMSLGERMVVNRFELEFLDKKILNLNLYVFNFSSKEYIYKEFTYSRSIKKIIHIS
jgi:hypothetical protein